MILHSLDTLYDRLRNDPIYQVAPSGYSLQKVSFKVVLTPTGALLAIQDAREPSRGTLRPKQILVPGHAKSSGSGLNPCLLWDNSGYMLGYKADDKNPQRTRQSFSAFRKKHVALEAEIGASVFSALCRFLEGWDPAAAQEHPVLADAARTGFGVFQIQGEARYVHDDPSVSAWWDAQREAESGGGELGHCLVSGEERLLARLHPKIKGVAGAQSAGAAIVSFNDDAYESYGKSQSYNAPVSKDVSVRYVTALNALLDGPMRRKHRFTLGDTTVAFWTEQPTWTEDIFLQFVSEGSALLDDPASQDEGVRQKLASFLQALREGRKAYGAIENAPDQTPFFLLGLAPNAARIAIRFFHRGTLAELLDNLRRHHRDISVAPQPAAGKRSADPEFPPVWLLLRQAARDSKEIPPILSGPLLRAIFTGSRYPAALYTAVIRRIGADATVNYARACVITGILNRNLKKDVSMSLDLARTDPAYRLGRLFAALEKTQKDALGESLNKTIRDSFYSAASATPGSVFPRLLRTYQHHLAKLEGGHRVNREKLIQEILAPLGAFSAHLDLSGQGLFAIGYYHQTRDFYTKREDTDAG